MTKLSNILKANVEIHGNELRGVVAQMLLDNVDHVSDLENYVSDVMQYGCISGCVSGMIYYHETVKFFDDNIEFIEDLLNEYDLLDEDQLDRFITVKYADEDDYEELEEMYDLSVVTEKNKYAWMAFELVTSDLYDEYVSELAV